MTTGIDFMLDFPVTFSMFRSLMAKRHYNVDDLVDLFRGKIEGTRDFFTRVMAPGVAHANVVIPYRSVLEWYYQEDLSEMRKKGLIDP